MLGTTLASGFQSPSCLICASWNAPRWTASTGRAVSGTIFTSSCRSSLSRWLPVA
jgi:hypothetical protein